MTPCSFVDYYEMFHKNVASSIRVEYKGKVKDGRNLSCDIFVTT